METMQAFRSVETAGTSHGEAPGVSGRADAAHRWRLDPLAPDEATDEVVVTTTRRLLRLATVAADVAARFVRERASHDPIEWMTAPRRLFSGGTAMDDCQYLLGFDRSVVVHGFGLDPDATVEDVERILSDDDGLPVRPVEDAVWDIGTDLSRSPRPRLLSCWVTASGRPVRLLAFCAMVTDRPEDLVEQVSRRYGAEEAAETVVEVGFDRGNPLVDALLCETLIDTLLLAASDPRSPAVRGLDLVVEQRFAA